MIYFNGFPFLDTKEQHAFHVPVSKAMTPVNSIALLPATGLRLSDLIKLLAETSYSGFPIVSDTKSRTIIGYIGRTELTFAIAKAKSNRDVSSTAKCIFTSEEQTSPAQTPGSAGPPVTFDDIDVASTGQSIDFSNFADFAPLSVHPQLPLETGMEIFKKMGPRVILVEHKGHLDGLVTVKDCLRYQFQAEAQERGGTPTTADNARRIERMERRTWETMVKISSWLGERIRRFTGGRIKLTSDSSRGSVGQLLQEDNRDLQNLNQDYRNILDGTETEMELEDDHRL